VTDFIKVNGSAPIVTTAPDWSDIFQLVRNYDRRRGGKQTVPGLWIHPSKPHQLIDFTIDRTGEDALMLKDRKLRVDRYRITLRSGDYTAWADQAGLVYKLAPARKPDEFVVLEGYEDATRNLTP
jgi:hypothetical protein